MRKDILLEYNAYLILQYAMVKINYDLLSNTLLLDIKLLPFWVTVGNCLCTYLHVSLNVCKHFDWIQVTYGQVPPQKEYNNLEARAQQECLVGYMLATSRYYHFVNLPGNFKF